MKRISVFVGSLSLATGGLFVVAAGASSLHVVATSRATGQYAVAETSGQVLKPSKIEEVVSSKPELSGLVQWTVGCNKGNKVIPSKRYKKTVKFPAVVHVKFAASSSTCVVAANVQIDGSGKVTIALESSR
ncbi:MAG TPA: hypothetical protein VNF05_00835 [Acidimicrobiales bacterium]|nr:hypothetical protein [Acidimicrobiales bacterium]